MHTSYKKTPDIPTCWHILAKPSQNELRQIQWLERVWSLPVRKQPVRETRQRFLLRKNGLVRVALPAQEARLKKPTFHDAAVAWLRAYRRWNGMKYDWDEEPSKETLELRERSLDPSPWDWAKMSSIQQFKRRTGLRLLEPQPGGLVVRGEHSMTLGQYERLAARGKLHGYWRQTNGYLSVDHTLRAPLPDKLGPLAPWEMPCAHHQMILGGHRECPLEERIQLLTVGSHTPNHPYTSFRHSVSSWFDKDTGQPFWKCQECDASGAGHYDLGTLVTSPGISYAWCGRGCGYTEMLPTPISGGASTNYYLSTTGSDSAAGTDPVTSPWATFAKARNVMEATDVLHVLAGTYDEQINTFANVGTSWSNFVYVKNYQADVPVVALTTTGQENCITLISGTQRYIQFEGMVMDGANMTASTGGVISIKGTTRDTNELGPMRFYDIECKNAPKNSVLVSYWTHHVEFVGGGSHDNGQSQPVDPNQHHLYYLAGTDHLIDGTESYQSVGYGHHNYSGGVNDVNDRMVNRAFLMRDTSYAGHIFWNGDDVLGYNGIVYDCGGDGLDGMRHRHGTDGFILNCTVYNNTGYGIDLEVGTNGWTVRNNIFLSNTLGATANSGGGTHTISTNLTSGTPTDVFNNPTVGNFTLKTGSAAIDAGVDLSATFNTGTWPQSPALDYPGNQRTGTWDQGAYISEATGGGGTFPIVGSVNGGVNNTNATTQTVNLPTNIASGNLLIIILTLDGTGAVTTPGGWTSLLDLVSSHAGANIRMGVWYRIADGSEGSTVSISNAAGEQSSHRTFRITDWHGTTPPEIASAQVALDTDSFTPDPPSLTPSWGSDATLWISVAGMDNGAAASTPPFVVSSYPVNYTNNQAISSGSNQTGTSTAVATSNIEAASDNPGTFTFDEDGRWISATIAVRPTVSAGAGSEGGLIQLFRNLGVY